MNILVVGSSDRPVYAPAFVSGFRTLGHNVKFIDYKDYGYSLDLPYHILDRIQNKYNIGLPLIRLNSDVIRTAKEFQPSFIFFYSCFHIFASTYRKLKQMGITFFTYCNDDPYCSILNSPWCKSFHTSLRLSDWNFVYRPKNVNDYLRDGINNVSIILPYFLSAHNYPEDVERDIPIAFLGHFENDGRDEYIAALCDKGINVTVFNGQYWEKAPLYKSIKQCIKERKTGKEYNHYLCRSQVAIVFLSKINHDTYTRRCFEIPATGTCMLCEYTEDMNRLFPENECAMYFRTEDEFVEKAKYLVSNPAECSRIGTNALKRLKEIGGSEVDRCIEIIHKYNEIQSV